jgi:hypothetical protein
MNAGGPRTASVLNELECFWRTVFTFFSFSLASKYLLLQLANARGGLGRGRSRRSGLGVVRGGRRISGHVGGGAELGLQVQNSTSLESKSLTILGSQQAGGHTHT